jgi:hypothetical protein
VTTLGPSAPHDSSQPREGRQRSVQEGGGSRHVTIVDELKGAPALSTLPVLSPLPGLGERKTATDPSVARWAILGGPAGAKYNVSLPFRIANGPGNQSNRASRRAAELAVKYKQRNTKP